MNQTRIMIRLALTLFLFVISAIVIVGQPSDQVLAVVGDERIRVADLPAQTAEAYGRLPAIVAEKRNELFELQVIDAIFTLEAAARKMTFEQLYQREVSAKVKDPAEPEIKKVYDANLSALGGRPLAEVRDRIVSFLRIEPEQKLFIAFVGLLKTKYRVVAGKNVNAPKLLPTDVLATIGGKPITVQAFESKNRTAIYETKARIFDQLRYDLDRLLLSALVTLEAETLGIGASQLLASEITDKMREFTDEERFALETTLRRRLAAKFKPQYMYSEPPPPVYVISTDGEPQRGAQDAPVTVIMFSDFQCSACSATHPVLQDVLGEYGSQVRFVVRDFPLQALHPNAYNAALAANAAAAQGKFFEYTDLLYRNQDALDAESLRRYATAVGLNPQKFELDFQGEKVASDVKKDIADGKLLGISGTPTIYVNGVRVRFLNADAFRDAIDKALRK